MIDLPLLAGLVGLSGLYLHGRRCAVRPASGWEILRFATAVLVLAIALGTPMQQAASTSLTAHMVQHQLLVLVAAPLLATARVGGALAAAAGWRRRPGTRSESRVGGTAVCLAAVHLGVLLAWHWPPASDVAVALGAVHHVEQLTLLGSGVLAWVAIGRAGEGARAVTGAVGALALLAVGGTALGAVLLSAPEVIYEAYAAVPGGLVEQQVAGALMAVGALVVYAGTAATITATWFGRLQPVDAG